MTTAKWTICAYTRCGPANDRAAAPNKEALTRTCERAAVLTIVLNITWSMDFMVERILNDYKLRTISPSADDQPPAH